MLKIYTVGKESQKIFFLDKFKNKMADIGSVVKNPSLLVSQKKREARDNYKEQRDNLEKQIKDLKESIPETKSRQKDEIRNIEQQIKDAQEKIKQINRDMQNF